MRIALVSEHASPLATLGGVDAGGQNVHVAALAAALVQSGHHVTVYTRRDSARLATRIIMPSRVVVEHVDAGPARPISKDAIYQYLPAFTTYLGRAWEDDRPDVIHSHFWMSALAAMPAANAFGIPLVHTYHALGIEKRRHQGAADTSPDERIVKEMAIAREADRVIATASAEVFELLRMGAEQRRLKIVPCGVDIDVFSPEGSREERHRDRMRIVSLSRLVPRKGVDTIIDALRSVPDAELIVAGGGESADLVSDVEAQRLLERARDAGVGDRVFLRGRVERAGVPALLRSADAVVCTPWYEPFGIVPLEAMACGVPVIASSVGGLVDTVVDGITGYHIPPRNPERLANALNALRVDRRLRSDMGKAGRERVSARFTWPRVAAECADIYRSVVQQKHSVATGA